MPGRAIIELDFAKAKAPNSQGWRDEVLLQCIDTVSELLEQKCERRFFTLTSDQWHSGLRALPSEDMCVQGCRLYLADPATKWALLPVISVGSITENGNALTVKHKQTATSWGTGEVAIIDNANGTVDRAYADGSNGYSLVPWTRGRGNIRIADVVSGYSIATMPSDLKEICRDMVDLIYREGSRTGQESVDEFGTQVRFARFINPYLQKAMELYAFTRSPITLEG